MEYIYHVEEILFEVLFITNMIMENPTLLEAAQKRR